MQDEHVDLLDPIRVQRITHPARDDPLDIGTARELSAALTEQADGLDPPYAGDIHGADETLVELPLVEEHNQHVSAMAQGLDPA